MPKPTVIIILGPPGSGKGTQAGLLSEKLGLYYFETSKILEKSFAGSAKKDTIEIKGERYYLQKEKKLWLGGMLCSPPFVAYLAKQKIKELLNGGENLILAGSPRTLFEGKEIIPFFKKKCGAENIEVILLKLSAKETIFRNSHRRICELMRHPILYTKETVRLKSCPLDGSRLIRRKGLDDPESIKVRLKEYKERTLPLIDYFKKQGLEAKEVNGEQSVADVFRDILKVLKK